MRPWQRHCRDLWRNETALDIYLPTSLSSRGGAVPIPDRSTDFTAINSYWCANLPAFCTNRSPIKQTNESAFSCTLRTQPSPDLQAFEDAYRTAHE